jgi:hypothetical protein
VTAYEWISVAQWGLTAIATVALLALRKVIRDSDLVRRLHEAETEIQRLRDWRHNVITAWQQQLPNEFVTRREWNQAREDGDSPWPKNRRNTPR